jgi:hypothetical protein
MSIEQRKLAWDITKMVVSILLAVSSFSLVNIYDKQVEEIRKMNEQLSHLTDELQSVKIKMVRVEYELKLK